MHKLIERVSMALMAFAALMIAFITLAITYGVIGRKVFAVAPVWVNDVTSYGLLAITFAGGAYVALNNGHVRVDLVRDRLSSAGKQGTQILSDLVCFLACGVLSVTAGIVAWDNFHQGTRIVRTVEMPKWIVIAVVASGTAIVALVYARRVLAGLRHRG